jgi:META domain
LDHSAKKPILVVFDGSDPQKAGREASVYCATTIPSCQGSESTHASTRIACPEAAMNQETRCLEALQPAERFDWKARYLLMDCQGLEKRLRFTRTSTKPVTP